MNLLVVGATGRVAKKLLSLLEQKGHTVYAGARHPERITPSSSIVPFSFDLSQDEETLFQQIEPLGIQAIYFVAGSKGKDLLQIDAFGAVKCMRIAESLKIKRFILLSSIFADQPEKWTDPTLQTITNYNIAKFFADQWLMQNTQLDYTIIQPGNLQETVGSGKITTNPEKSMPISIDNVAAVLAESLTAEASYRKVIPITDGEIPIIEAIHHYPITKK